MLTFTFNSIYNNPSLSLESKISLIYKEAQGILKETYGIHLQNALEEAQKAHSTESEKINITLMKETYESIAKNSLGFAGIDDDIVSFVSNNRKTLNIKPLISYRDLFHALKTQDKVATMCFFEETHNINEERELIIYLIKSLNFNSQDADSFSTLIKKHPPFKNYINQCIYTINQKNGFNNYLLNKMHIYSYPLEDICGFYKTNWFKLKQEISSDQHTITQNYYEKEKKLKNLYQLALNTLKNSLYSEKTSSEFSLQTPFDNCTIDISIPQLEFGQIIKEAQSFLSMLQKAKNAQTVFSKEIINYSTQKTEDEKDWNALLEEINEPLVQNIRDEEEWNKLSKEINYLISKNRKENLIPSQNLQEKSFVKSNQLTSRGKKSSVFFKQNSILEEIEQINHPFSEAQQKQTHKINRF